MGTENLKKYSYYIVIRITSLLCIQFLLFPGCEYHTFENELQPVVEVSDTCQYEGFYYYKGEKTWLKREMSNDYLLIGVDSMVTNLEIQQFITSREYFAEISSICAHYKYKHVIAKFSTGKTCTEITSIINDLKKNEFVEFAHYTIQTNDCISDAGEFIGKKCIDSYDSRFLVKVRNLNDLGDLSRICQLTNTEIVEQNKFIPEYFTINADKYSQGDSWQMANYFHELVIIENTTPGFGTYVVEELE